MSKRNTRSNPDADSLREQNRDTDSLQNQNRLRVQANMRRVEATAAAAAAAAASDVARRIAGDSPLPNLASVAAISMRTRASVPLLPRPLTPTTSVLKTPIASAARSTRAGRPPPTLPHTLSTSVAKTPSKESFLVPSYEISIGNVNGIDGWIYDKIKALCKKVGLDSSKSRTDMLKDLKKYLVKRNDHEGQLRAKFAKRKLPELPEKLVRETRSKSTEANSASSAPVAPKTKFIRVTKPPPPPASPPPPAESATTVGKFRFLYCSKTTLRKTLCACVECGGGSQLCQHGKQKHKCKTCKGPSLCAAHGNQKSRCLACKDAGVYGCGNGICVHRRERWRCNEPECESSNKKRKLQE